jgi:hypothetical protein
MFGAYLFLVQYAKTTTTTGARRSHALDVFLVYRTGNNKGRDIPRHHFKSYVCRCLKAMFADVFKICLSMFESYFWSIFKSDVCRCLKATFVDCVDEVFTDFDVYVDYLCYV